MQEVRWLDEREQRVWRAYLQATALLTQRLSADLEGGEHGLSMAEYELLVRLSEAPGWSVRMSELAGGLVHSRSRLTHTAARMEARGWLRRQACPDDRRGVLAVMTQAGHDALAATAPLHVTGVREQLFDRLSPADVEALGRISAALAEGLREQPPG